MDFKSLMAAQISKSKPTSNGTSATSKYQRKADLEAERQAAYEAEQTRLQEEREERAAKKRKLEEGDAERAAEREAKLQKLAAESKARREAQDREDERRRRKRLGLPDLPDPSIDDDPSLAEGKEDIPDPELRDKLRALNEPSTLYAESHPARLKRYYNLIHPPTAAKLTTGPIPTILAPLEEAELLIPTTLPSPTDIPGTTFLYRQIASYFTLLLTNWSHDLSQRDAETKSSSSGIAAYNAYLTVLKDLTPLFRQLESRSLPPDLLSPLCDIIRHAQSRRYVKANDAYLTLSIGKAAWPIGVTMVGIHERSAREKLHEQDNKGHVMGDEVTRKMLQSVKRCLSYAQVRWPPEDLAELMG